MLQRGLGAGYTHCDPQQRRLGSPSPFRHPLPRPGWSQAFPGWRQSMGSCMAAYAFCSAEAGLGMRPGVFVRLCSSELQCRGISLRRCGSQLWCRSTLLRCCGSEPRCRGTLLRRCGSELRCRSNLLQRCGSEPRCRSSLLRCCGSELRRRSILLRCWEQGHSYPEFERNKHRVGKPGLPVEARVLCSFGVRRIAF